MLPGSKISHKMEKFAAEVLQLFCGCMAKAGTRKLLSEVGFWCLHREWGAVGFSQRGLGGRSEGLSASEDRGRTLIVYVPHCSFISSVWLQEILLSLIIEFAFNSLAFRFGGWFCRNFRWQTCSLLQADRLYAVLWFSRGKCVVSVYNT